MLDAFLEDMAASPFEDGKADCALTVADWVSLATGCADPAAPLRGQYHSELQRERLLRKMGGLTFVVAECARYASLQSTKTPARNDVGVIRVGRLTLAAICLGQRWAVKGRDGLCVFLADEVLSAWEVPIA